MLIKMQTAVFMAKEGRTLAAGETYDIPEEDAEPMVDAGLATCGKCVPTRVSGPDAGWYAHSEANGRDWTRYCINGWLHVHDEVRA